MLAKLRPRLTYANVMATLAVFLGLSTGGAYATHLVVNGSDVVDESLTGSDVRGKPGTSTTPSVNGSLSTYDISGQPANAANGSPFVQGSLTTWDIADGTLRSADVLDNSLGAADLAPGSVNTSEVADNSLGGADVLESSLGKVPSADTLDGIDSTGLVQGRGTLLSNRLVSVPNDPMKTLLQIPGLGQLEAHCFGGSAQISWHNTTAATIDRWIERLGSWLVNLSAPDHNILIVDSDSFPGTTLALGLGNDPGPRRIATLHVFAFQQFDGFPCGFQAQGTLWVSP